MIEGTVQKEDKQANINTSLNYLWEVVNRLEKFVKRIENNNEPEPSCDKDQVPDDRPSLSVFLTKLPEMIESERKRIDESIEKLMELLY